MTAKRAVLFDMDGVLLDGWTSSPQKRHRWDRMMEADLGVILDVLS